ncbi:MAG TPA: type II secretion system protein [Blastocatellia bacterium]
MRSKFWIRSFHGVDTLRATRFSTGRAGSEVSDESGASLMRNPRPGIRNPQSGFTLLEIIIVITILSVLTAAAVPMVRNSVKRQREEDLRLALREIRQAIDRYKDYAEQNPTAIPIALKTPTFYPKNLKLLVEGFAPSNVAGTSGPKKKFLRRLPIDPMTGRDDWGVRSYKDDPNSTSTDGDDVFDVYSKSDGVPLNGVGKYRDW